MSRLHYAIILAGIFACTDQTEPPPAASQPEDVALDDNVSGVELELDAGRIDREAHTALSGGATTVFREDDEAFETAAPNLAGLNLAKHEAGDVAFELEHVAGSDPANGGLGPVFDNVSCEGCHLGDGRGRPPEDGLEFLLDAVSLQHHGPGCERWSSGNTGRVRRPVADAGDSPRPGRHSGLGVLHTDRRKLR